MVRLLKLRFGIDLFLMDNDSGKRKEGPGKYFKAFVDLYFLNMYGVPKYGGHFQVAQSE